MSSKYEYTEDMVDRMNEVCSSGVDEDKILALMEEFNFPRRSVAAKLRKQGFDVPKKPGDAPKFSEQQTEDLKSFLEENSGEFTAEEIAGDHFTDFTARQITGKALSLEMTHHIKPAERKVTPKTYTEAQEKTIAKMVDKGAYLEDIAEAVDKPVNSVRGKLLSMQLKAPQKNKKESAKDPYDGIQNMLTKTVDELAEHFDKTPRGVKTVLSRRKLACADYTPKTLNSDS